MGPMEVGELLGALAGEIQASPEAAELVRITAENGKPGGSSAPVDDDEHDHTTYKTYQKYLAHFEARLSEFAAARGLSAEEIQSHVASAAETDADVDESLQYVLASLTYEAYIALVER